jgi:hypothetical protein
VQTSIVDAGRLGHQFTFKNKQNNEHVQAKVLENCMVTTVETAAKLCMSVGSAHAIVHNGLEFNKVCSRWISKHLTDQLKQNCVTSC